MTDADMDHLEYLATLAEPGPWLRHDTGTQCGVISGELPTTRAYLTPADKAKRICSANASAVNRINLDYIAAADPTTVLELIQELKRLRRAAGFFPVAK